MVCIYCGSPTQVSNSRFQKRSNQVWRRRKCTVCGNVFTTHELAELSGSLMVRTAKTKLAPFSRDKLFISIYESCKHRPSAADDAAALAQTITARLVTSADNAQIDRDDLIIIASEILERFDNAAATAYKAYHPIKR